MVNGYFTETAINHGVVESSNLLATTRGAHIFSVKAEEDIDNGHLVNLDDMSCIKSETVGAATVKSYSHEYFTMVEPTATSRVGLIASVAIGPDEKPAFLTRESAFYNAAGELMRVYDLYFGDKFVASEVCFDGEPEVGKFVVADGYNMSVVDEADDSAAFLGEIIDKENKFKGGSPMAYYKVLVKRNGK